MSPIKRYAKKQAKARQRRRLHAHERLERDKRQAQRAAEALHQALQELGLPEDLVAEIGYPFSPGHYATSITYHEDLMALPGQGQRIDLR